MKKFKQLVAEFKKFIAKGNVVDLAVGVIIGASFTAIVNAFSSGIIMPLINLIVGGQDASTLTWVIKEVYTTDASGAQILDTANSVILDFGTLLNSIFDFLIIALVLFAVVKFFTGLKNVGETISEQTSKQAKKLAKKLQKKGVSKQEAEALASAQIAEQSAAQQAQPVVAEPIAVEPVKPTTEELLIQIRDLLAAQNAPTEHSDKSE